MATTFPTWWTTSVFVDGCCKGSMGADTLSEAISKATCDAVYYQAIYPDGAVTIDAHEQCAQCYNLGTVVKRTARTAKNVRWDSCRGKLARCPSCRGKLAHGKVEGIRFTMPDAAKIHLMQDDSPKAWDMHDENPDLFDAVFGVGE